MWKSPFDGASMNHLELLKKYMKVVLANEPWNYLGSKDLSYAGVELSEAEFAELERIEKEIQGD